MFTHFHNLSINDLTQVAFRGFLDTDGNGVFDKDGIFLFTPEVHWRGTEGDQQWDSRFNWTLGIPPAHVHPVFVDPTTAMTIQGPTASTIIASLAVGSGDALNVATLQLQTAGPLTVLGDTCVGVGGQIDLPNAGTSLTVGSDFSGHGTTGYGTVVVEGGVRPGLGPGTESIGTMSFEGNVQLETTVVTHIDVGETANDQIQVIGTGILTLDGELSVDLYDGFTPLPSDPSSFLTTDLPISGEFTNAPKSALTLTTPFGDWTVTYSTLAVEISGFTPDPLASAASIGSLSGYAGELLGGATTTTGVDVQFMNNEVGVVTADFQTVVGTDLADLIACGAVDFELPTFVLPNGDLQVWEIDFEGDEITADVQLVVAYDDTGLSIGDEEALDLYHFDNGAWVGLGGTVNTTLNTITATTLSLSPFAIGVPLSGDFDYDGDVDGADLLAWQRGESPNPLSSSDLADWQGNFGDVASSILAASTTVPEPTTGLLLMLGLAALLFRRAGF